MAESNRPVKHGEADQGSGLPRASTRNTRQAARRTGGRRGLNLFDAIVIVLVIAVAVLLGVGIHMGDLFTYGEGESVTIDYTLTLSNVDEAYANAIRRGDEIYGVDSATVLGEVTEVPTVVPHTEITLRKMEDGTLGAVETSVPGRVDITLTVRAHAEYRAGEGYYVGAQDIRVGKMYTVRFVDYLGNAQCVRFDGTSAVSR